MDINNVVMSGNLTFDPEIVTLQSGDKKCNFRLAVSGRNNRADFFPVTVWGQNAQNCFQWLKKGSRVLIRGRLTLISYEKDGAKRNFVEVTAEDVIFISGTKEGNRTQKMEQGRMDELPPADPVDEDELPF